MNIPWKSHSVPSPSELTMAGIKSWLLALSIMGSKLSCKIAVASLRLSTTISERLSPCNICIQYSPPRGMNPLLTAAVRSASICLHSLEQNQASAHNGANSASTDSQQRKAVNHAKNKIDHRLNDYSDPCSISMLERSPSGF